MMCYDKHNNNKKKPLAQYKQIYARLCFQIKQIFDQIAEEIWGRGGGG